MGQLFPLIDFEPVLCFQYFEFVSFVGVFVCVLFITVMICIKLGYPVDL